MCGYNGSIPSVESLHQEVSVLVPDPTVSCLDDPSHLPDQLEDTPILSEVSLEPFNTLAPGRFGGWLPSNLTMQRIASLYYLEEN